ncbi:hypothetical protein OQA88_7294 [Cercophora sp. LCS_1]
MHFGEHVWLKFAFKDRMALNADKTSNKTSITTPKVVTPEVAPPVTVNPPGYAANANIIEPVPARVQQTAWESSTNMNVSAVERADGMAGEHGRLGVKRTLALLTLACMWVSAQAPLYLMELGGARYWVWFVTANLLATAAISPFVGALSDLAGRRWVALAGSLMIVVGQIVCSTAKDMVIFICGMAITGVGTGVNELTVLAGVAELVPVSQRGYYLSGIVATIIPFIPSVMWAQLIASSSSWRYIGAVSASMAGIALILTFLFYAPPAQTPDQQRAREDKIGLVKRMDLIGGLLSITGLAGLEVGLLGGGYQNPWTSTEVLAPLFIGVSCLTFFAVWEIWGTPYPMVPRRLGRAPRTLVLTIVITFISGANFFSVIMIWPTQAYNVYGHDPVGVGIRGMPFVFGTLGGCFISLALLSFLRGKIKWLLFGASVLATAGCGSLAAARVDNTNTVYALLFIAGLGVGGIVVPASMVTTYICPEDLLATITSLTIAIRIVGGAVGYAVYFNVFANKLGPQLHDMVGGTCVKLGITDPKTIGTIIELTAASMVDKIPHLPGVGAVKGEAIIKAGQVAFSHAYPWVYYCSIAFGAVSILASLGLEDISKFVDDHVAVVI